MTPIRIDIIVQEAATYDLPRGGKGIAMPRWLVSISPLRKTEAFPALLTAQHAIAARADLPTLVACDDASKGSTHLGTDLSGCDRWLTKGRRPRKPSELIQGGHWR